MDNEAKQRFISLDVAEVSVVDTPAVDVEFLVIKRKLEGTEMPQETTPQADNNKPALVPVTVDTSKAVSDAMASVTELVREIAKSAGVQVKSDDERDAEGDAAVEAVMKGMGAVRKNQRETLKGLGVDAEVIKSSMKKFDDTVGVVATETKTEKATESKPENKGDDASDALNALSEAITKAKVFTPTRQEKFDEALEKLKAVIDEMRVIPQGTMPGVLTPGLKTSPLASTVSITKALEDMTSMIAKALVEQNTALVETSKRVAEIEKARAPSNSLPAETTEAPKTVQKSFWSGAL